jgi:hypothetical protein
MEVKKKLAPALSKVQQGKAVPVASQPMAGLPTDELEKLAELKEKGILTEEEFAAKKKQLLGL